MPLHVFEDRYRSLIADLLDLPADEPRRFGVLCIEIGHEVGEMSAHQLCDVGCVAEMRTVRKHEDGRFDLLVEGVSRFRVEEYLDDGSPYLRAAITPMPDEVGADADAYAERAGRLFTVYRDRLQRHGIPIDSQDDFPAEPLPLSYALSAALLTDRHDKQELLESDHAAARLERAGELLRRENRLLSTLPLLPAGQFMQHDVNLN
ncbi:hypothetical protein CLV63_119145 [Murinocardiopsis flavida]|uniref:Lon N-terminal domain-containing protein n=2 Tax=Murinocardiopsis flavida TaxID=645275 RepID=A0A2P8D3S8_9ACTN|nr:hypothetical protein CLV63_119145 [Murinocardiopsis flavida]